jgi:MFS transporter, PHS family, inorganic phosphate transporter
LGNCCLDGWPISSGVNACVRGPSTSLSQYNLITPISDGIELVIILTSTFAQALAGSGPGVNIIGVLIVWRFMMGVDMGGDHPLSAVISSEFASTGSRGRLMTTAFTAQSWGNLSTHRHFYMEVGNTKLVLALSLVALITVHPCRGSILTDNNSLEHVDYCWRILIGLGCVPGAIALYFRLTIPETPRFTMDIDRDIQKARTDIENVLGPNGGSAAVYWVDPDAVVQRTDASRGSRSDLINYFAQPSNLLLLFGAAYSWFAIDASPISYIGWRDVITDLRGRQQVAFYGLGLNSSSILTSTLLIRAGIVTTTLSICESLHNVVFGSLLVCVAGLLPSYYATLFLIDVWGRRPIQFLGFAMLTALLAILGKMTDHPSEVV